MSGFRTYPFHTGLLDDLSNDPFPSALWAWNKGRLELSEGGTHFGFLHQGRGRLVAKSGSFDVYEGMYFSTEGECSIEGEGRGVVITRFGCKGFFSLGGPIEKVGRLRYIDGCTDSLLIPPVLRGDPCLNLLHFPPQIHQTAHTHPSLRLGLVTRGRGDCLLQDKRVPLLPGVIFLIPADLLHSFATAEESMTVIAYHPDSDFGPTHESHPMINRTIVDGVSASQIEAIQTRNDPKSRSIR